jgi:hypothetical protein
VVTKARIVHDDQGKGREDGKAIVSHLSSISKFPHGIKFSLLLQQYFVKVCNIFHLGHPALPYGFSIQWAGYDSSENRYQLKFFHHLLEFLIFSV